MTSITAPTPSASMLSGAGAHGPCIGNLSRIAQIVQAAEGARAAARAQGGGVGLPSLPAARNLAGLLGALPIGAASLSLPGRLAELLSLSRGLGRLFPLASRTPGGVVNPLAHLEARVAAMKGVLLRPPQLPTNDLLRGGELLSAARILAPLRINIFSPGGGAALGAYLGRLRADGLLHAFAGPGLPNAVTQSLTRFGGAAEGMRLLGLDPRMPHVGVPQARLGSIASEVQGSPLALLSSDRGLALIPHSGELGQMSASLSALRLERELSQLLPRIGGPGGRVGDPLPALEASGCCQVLREFGELKSTAAVAHNANASRNAMESIGHGFGVNPQAPDPTRLATAMQHVARVEADAPQSMRSMLHAPESAAAGRLAFMMTQFGALG